MKHGILVCYGRKAYKNIGDYIQSVAAAQYAGPEALRIERESLDTYDGDPVKVVMNGWFMSNPRRFPPSDRIVPLFTSFHVKPGIEGRFFRDDVVACLKAREPIGCRSTDVVEMMSRHGIKAEFSSCLTLTLGETFRHEEVNTPPVFVDILKFNDKPYSVPLCNKFEFDLIFLKHSILAPIPESTSTSLKN